MPSSQDILKYFPDYPVNVYPNKQYMMDILNTLDPGLIIKTIKDIRKKRDKNKEKN